MAIGDLILLFIALVSLLLLITLIGSLCVLVPYVPTPPAVVRKMVDFADLKGGETIYDLGCGDARILIEALRRKPNVRAIGYELPLGIWMLAKVRVYLAGFPVEIRMRDLWTANLSDADVVFLYLFPEVCAKLEKKLERELKPGAKVISHGFALPNWKPEKVERVPLQSWHWLHSKYAEGPRVFLYTR